MLSCQRLQFVAIRVQTQESFVDKLLPYSQWVQGQISWLINDNSCLSSKKHEFPQIIHELLINLIRGEICG